MIRKASNTENPLAPARASYAAYVAKESRALENLIAEDFHFTSPLDNRLDRASYFKYCWPGSEKIKCFKAEPGSSLI